jgi:hypothetical protein
MLPPTDNEEHRSQPGEANAIAAAHEMGEERPTSSATDPAGPALLDLIRGGCSLAELRRFNFEYPSARQWTDAYGNSPLILAAEQGNLEVVNELIGLGADTRWHTDNGRTALTAALQGGYTLIAIALLNAALVHSGRPPISTDDWRFPITKKHRLPPLTKKVIELADQIVDCLIDSNNLAFIMSFAVVLGMALGETIETIIVELGFTSPREKAKVRAAIVAAAVEIIRRADNQIRSLPEDMDEEIKLVMESRDIAVAPRRYTRYRDPVEPDVLNEARRRISSYYRSHRRGEAVDGEELELLRAARRIVRAHERQAAKRALTPA